MTQLQSIPTARVKQQATVLIASSDTSFRQKVGGVLEGLHWSVQQAAGGAETLVYLDENDCEALIVDSWLHDLEVNEVISECRRRYPQTDLLTQGMSRLDLASLKNSRRQELWYALGRGQGEEACSEARAVPYLESQAGRRMAYESARPSPDITWKLPEIVGSGPAIRELCRQIRLVAPAKANVLIEGPTGTGKELVARAVHRLSKRSRKPFIVMNCAAIPEALLEAELFGHTRGAFTGAVQPRLGRLEAANGGTLFLDEIGEMPPAFQSKLLRFLEQGEIQRIGENEPVKTDVRVIAATHQFLEQRVSEGSFRQDLYFRLAVFPLVTPSLSERPEDIPELVEHFLRRLASGQPAKGLHPTALERLMAHSWPGGVRELEHVLERGYILGEDRPEITAAEIRFGSGRPMGSPL